jgi:hypothetical protein
VSGDVVASSFRTPDPREITTVTAKNIIYGNVEVKGTLDTINTEIPDRQGTGRSSSVRWTPTEMVSQDDVTDTLRDTGGIIVSGTPNIPVGKDALLCTNIIRGSRMAISMARCGHGSSPKAYVAVQRRWSVHPDPDLNDVGSMVLCTLFRFGDQQRRLCMYFKASGFDPVLVQNFSTNPIGLKSVSMAKLFFFVTTWDILMVCSLYTLSRFIFVSLLEKQHMFKRTASSVVEVSTVSNKQHKPAAPAPTTSPYPS